MLKYAKNIKSQFGEDGIIEHLLSKIPTSKNPWSVEFGAWDGEYLSNTYNLVFNKNWNSVYIEGDNKKANDLQKKVDSLKGNQEIHVINAFIQSKGQNSLDSLLSQTNIPQEFEVLSIDIDSIDYHVWKNFINYNPKIVIIEHNPTIPPEIEYIPNEDYSITGASVRALYNLGLEKKYSLVACTDVNCIFVRDEFFSLFNITDNTPEHLMKKDYITYLISNFDGSYCLTKEPAYINIFDNNLPEKMRTENIFIKRVFNFYKKTISDKYREILIQKSLFKQ